MAESVKGLKCTECGTRLRCIDSRPGDGPGKQERRYNCPNCGQLYFSHSDLAASTLQYRRARARSVAECRERRRCENRSRTTMWVTNSQVDWAWQREKANYGQ